MTTARRVVLVTGSSRGIGNAVAAAFAKCGDRVVLNSRSDHPDAHRTVEQIRNAGGDALYVPADVSDPAAVDSLFEATEEYFGPVDVLVNNAGRTDPTEFLESPPAHWAHMINVNLMPAVLCSVRAARTMMDRSGSIINTSSIRGVPGHGRTGVMAYSAAKAAVNSLTQSMAAFLAPNVRVNAVAPGFVTTSYLDRISDEQQQSWLETIPLKKFIEAKQIANAYLYLADSDYVTGTILVADAGLTLGHD